MSYIIVVAGHGAQVSFTGKKIMKFTSEEQQIIRRAEAIIASKLPATDYMNSPEMVRSFLRLHFAPAERELFGVLFLDTQHGIIAFEELFQGTIDACQVYVRIIAQKAMMHNARSVILVHNHPSMQAEPSAADKAITLRIKAALGLVEVTVLDHLIVAGNNFTSFAESGLL